MTTDKKSLDEGMDDGLANLGELDFDFVTSDGQENVWCDQCKSLKQELQRLQEEHTLNYNTLKKKIISTDLLIKKYKAKCEDHDSQTKKLEEMGKKLETSQRESETLRVQLGSALQQIEPMKKAKQAIEADNNLKKNEIQTLKDNLTAAVTVKKQYENLAKDSSEYKEKYEGLKKSHTKRIKELESSYSKQEIQLLKYKDECQNLKSEQTINAKKHRKLENRLRKTVGRIDRYWVILKENGLLPKGEKKLRTEHYLTDTRDDSPLEENNDCLPLLEKQYRYSDDDNNDDEDGEDIDDMMMSWTFSPVVHALSPLPPSPLTIRRMHSQDKADSDEGEEDEKDDEFAKQLESEFLTTSETKSKASSENSSFKQGRQLTRQAATTENCNRPVVSLADTAVLNTSKGFSISEFEEDKNQEVDENIPQVQDISGEHLITDCHETLDTALKPKIENKESVSVKPADNNQTGEVAEQIKSEIKSKEITIAEIPKPLSSPEKILNSSTENKSNVCETVAAAENDLKVTISVNAQKPQPSDSNKTAEETVSVADNDNSDLAKNDPMISEVDNSCKSPSTIKTRLSRSVSMPLRTSPRSNNLKNRSRRSTCSEMCVSDNFSETQLLKTSGETNKSAKFVSVDNNIKKGTSATPVRVTRSTAKSASASESLSGAAVRSNTRTRMPTSRLRKSLEKDPLQVTETTKEDTKKISTQNSSPTEVTRCEIEEREVSAIWSPRRFTRAMSRQVSTGFMSKASSEPGSPTPHSPKSDKRELSSVGPDSEKHIVLERTESPISENQGLSSAGTVSRNPKSSPSITMGLEHSKSRKQDLSCTGRICEKSSVVTIGSESAKSGKQEFTTTKNVSKKTVLKGFVSAGFESFKPKEQELLSCKDSFIKSREESKITENSENLQADDIKSCSQFENKECVSNRQNLQTSFSKTSITAKNNSSAKTECITHTSTDLKPSKAVIKLDYDRVNENSIELKKHSAQKTMKPVKSSQPLSKEDLSLPINPVYKQSVQSLQKNIATSTVNSPSVMSSNEGGLAKKSPTTPTTNAAVLSASSPVSPLPPSPFDFFIPIAISPLPPSPARGYESPLSPLPGSPWEEGINDDSGDSTPRAIDQCNITDSSGDMTPVQTPTLFLSDHVSPGKNKSPTVLADIDRMNGNPCSFHAEVPAGLIKPKISKTSLISPKNDIQEEMSTSVKCGTATKRKSTEKHKEPQDKKICIVPDTSKVGETSKSQSVPLWKVIDEDMKDFMNKSMQDDMVTKGTVVQDMVQLLLARDHGNNQGSVLPVLLQWIVQCLRCNQVESLTVLQPCLEDEKKKTETDAHIPLITNQEEWLLRLVVYLSSHWESIQQKLLECLWNAVFLTDVVPTSGVTSLCRMITALCSIKGDIEQVHVLYYNILTRSNLPCTFLASAIAGVWPTSLLKKESDEQPILTVIEHVVTQQLLPGKPVCEKIQVCLEKLCKWSRITLDSRTILRQLLKFLEDESRQTSPRKHMLFEAEKALELLIYTEPLDFYKMSFVQCGLNQTSQRFSSDNWVKKDTSERINKEYVKAILRITTFGILRKANITTKYVNSLIKKHYQKILETKHASFDVQICVIEMLLELSFLTPGSILFLLRTWFNSHRSHIPDHLCQRLSWTRDTLVKKFPGIHCDPFT